MKHPPLPHHGARTAGRSHRATAALALVEVVLSIGILGGLMVAVMNAVGAAAVSSARTMERVQGSALAESLMAEILAAQYDGTTVTEPLISLETTILGITIKLTSPTGEPSRGSFESVDDYHGWGSSPPLARDGSVIPGYDDWAQSVTVEPVSLAAPGGAAAGADTGLKRITVVISRNGREICRMVTLRARAWEAALDAR